MNKNILGMKPAQVPGFWKIEGEPPFCKVTVRGISDAYELDEISSFIWLYLDGSHTIDFIIKEICKIFEGAERRHVEQDVIKVLKRWEADDLINLNYTPLYPYKVLKTLQRIKNKRPEKNSIRRTVEKKPPCDILLIVPPTPQAIGRLFNQFMGGVSPLGIGYMSSLLQKHGFQTDCLNLYLGVKDPEIFEHYVAQIKPKIIGFSTMTDNFQNGLLLARLVRKIHSDATIVFGGPHVAFMYEEALANDCIDIVVRREGEYAMLELANYFVRGNGALGDIKGIAYRTNGTAIHTAVRPMIEDLNALPYPRRDIPNLETGSSPELGKGRQIIITSRGCPGKCKFCAASALSGGKYRMRSIDNIAGELMEIKSQGGRVVFVGDDTISGDISRLLKLCDLLKREKMQWTGECRVDAITKDLAQTLKNSGCIGLQFGVESGSQEMLDRMGKDITLQQVEQAVSLTTEAGIGVLCSLMIGMPEDTISTIGQTIEFADTLQKKYNIAVVLSCFVVYPGTYYYYHAQELGISISTRNYDLYSTASPIIDTVHLTKWQIRRLYYGALPILLRSLPANFKKQFLGFSIASLIKEGYKPLPQWWNQLEK